MKNQEKIHKAMNNQSTMSGLLKALSPGISLFMLLFFSVSAYSLSSGKSNFIPQGDENIHKRSYRPDAAFRTIEDESDVWSWDSRIIKRYHKSTDTWTYFWAPVRYSQLEIRWDKQSRTIFYFLNGDQITEDRARKFTPAGSGFQVGSKIPVGGPQFSLQRSSSFPEFGKGEKKRLLKKGIGKLKDQYHQYQQKYRPQCWQFTALALAKDSLWVAVRSIPHKPESFKRFILPNGIISPRHYKESSVTPTQGGILRIDKDTGEYKRFTEENGLPEKLICRPLEKKFSELPHFLASHRFPQEVVDIEPLEGGLIRFTTRSQRQVVYDSEQGTWKDVQ